MTARAVRFVLLLMASWLVMTTTHEVGHLVGGWCSGGTLADADLLPWHLPYSNFDPDPMPLVTLWCGPILGALVPTALALSVRRPAAWFVANFCILANGSYLAAGWLTGDRFLDTTRLLDRGTPAIAVAAYCLVTIGYGYLAFRRSCIAAMSPRRPTVAERDRPVT